jgi:copper oxidase (laccase) domain-containing protein
MEFLAFNTSEPLALPLTFSRAFGVERTPLAHQTNSLVDAFLETRLPMAERGVSVAFAHDAPAPGTLLLEQIHSAALHWVESDSLPALRPKGDGWLVRYSPERFGASPLRLGIRTADCLPVVLAARVGGEVWCAAVHAGWRGFCLGIHYHALRELSEAAERGGVARNELLRHLDVLVGPAIFGRTYECGSDVALALEDHWREWVQPLPAAAPVAAAYRACCDVTRAEVSASEAGTVGSAATARIFPDFQLLMCCDLVAAGVEQGRIRVVRENTYESEFLFSYRRATHSGGDVRRRLVTQVTLGL